MRTVQSIMALAIVGSICGANLYWHVTADWLAAGFAVLIAAIACLVLQKSLSTRAHESLRKEYGQDWS